ncbi:MAG: ABC transporter permease subunit [Lachnospiraceae bacterium]|nr:ABC transporter permease subunit [Lachnospiraceae bacterium]
MVLFWHECRQNRKNLFIWALCVGALCFGCLLLYGSLEESMEDMAGMFSELGAFSMALGMDKINIGTLEGFYAIEIALILSLGGALFAALTGSAICAKEEEGHTAEFIHTLPVSRSSILVQKYGAMVGLMVVFEIINILLILAGFTCMGSMPDMEKFVLYHGACFLMHLEIGSICFLLSAVMKKKPTGAALGLSVFLYLADLLCRVLPDLENAKYITPYYYANAADIFAEGSINPVMLGTGVVVSVLSFLLALLIYNKRDIIV